MLRLVALLTFTAVAFGQLLEQLPPEQSPPKPSAYISIETTAGGDLHATLTVPMFPAPAALPAAFARAAGCASSGIEKTPYEARISVRCPTAHPSALTFHAALRLAELKPFLLQTGAAHLDLIVIAPHYAWVHLDPPLALQGRPGDGYRHAHFALDRLPPQITLDGGFEISQIQTLAVAAVLLVLAPFLLLFLRPSNPLYLTVEMEGIFVLSWIGWIWALLRMQAGALLTYLFGQWPLGTLLILLVPALLANSIGSWLAARQYTRIAPTGLAAAHYRRTKFWSGAAAACFACTLLNLLLSISNSPFWPFLFGLVLTLACLLYLRRTGRGSSHPLPAGDLRNRIFALAAKAGVNLRSVTLLTSPTPRPPLALAFRWGVVMLNEALLKHLSRREVDAIVCHELSHLRPAKRLAMAPVYLLLVLTILASQWIPNFVDFIPLSLLVAYFLFKAWRRAGERQADLDSVRWSGDPEAMITGLARVSAAHGMPITWGVPVSWMMAHPPTMTRLRAIANAGRLDDSRLAELLEESRRDAPGHYAEASFVPQSPASIPDEAAFSPALRRRLQTRLSLFALASPLVFGLPAFWLLERSGLSWLNVLLLGSLFSILAMVLGADWIAGSVRHTVKQRAVARHGQGVFVGLSPAAEPRLFDGMYHYDLGIVRFLDGALEFTGDRARFTLDKRSVQRVWLGDGPRHWTPRKVVYVACLPSPEAGPMIFSLQSLEAWCWPSTLSMAKRLHRDTEAWFNGSYSSPAPPLPCPLPRVEGNPNTFIPLRTALRSIGTYAGIAFLLASIKTSLDGGALLSYPFEVLGPVAVCGLLALFLVWPSLFGSRPRPLSASPTRVPAQS